MTLIPGMFARRTPLLAQLSSDGNAVLSAGFLVLAFFVMLLHPSSRPTPRVQHLTSLRSFFQHVSSTMVFIRPVKLDGSSCARVFETRAAQYVAL